MTPGPRVRSRIYPDFVGYSYPASNPADKTAYSVQTGMERCEDVVGFRANANYFDLTRMERSVGHMTGIEAVWPVYGFDKMPYFNQPYPDILPGSDFEFIDPAAALTRVAAWTSPGRASVSLPNFIHELRDIPGMMQQKHRPRKKKANHGNSAVEYNFGWGAMFSDIAKMFDFASDFEKRKRELNAIFDRPGGLKRQRVVAEGTVVSVNYVAANSWVCGVGVNRTNVTTSRQWASLSWKPLFGAFAEKPSDAAIAAKAKASIHGWRANPALVWDALPWTWFADYFSNMGDLLEATSNSMEYLPDMCCVMNRTTTTIIDKVVVQSPDFIVTPAKLVIEWKHRQPTTFGLRFTNPLLSGSQLVTLASIASNWGSG